MTSSKLVAILLLGPPESRRRSPRSTRRSALAEAREVGLRLRPFHGRSSFLQPSWLPLLEGSTPQIGIGPLSLETVQPPADIDLIEIAGDAAPDSSRPVR